MEQAEKLGFLRELRSGRGTLGEALLGVDDAMAARKPGHGGWSILDCVEHMVASERYLLTRLRAAELSERPFEKSRREGKIATLAADRTRRIEAPEPVHPQGRYRSLEEALAEFDKARAEVEQWVEDCKGNPRCMMTDHPLIVGPVTCSETLIMMAAHPARHAQQISVLRNEFATKAH